MVSNLFQHAENLEETQTIEERTCCFAFKKKKTANQKLVSKKTKTAVNRSLMNNKTHNTREI